MSRRAQRTKNSSDHASPSPQCTKAGHPGHLGELEKLWAPLVTAFLRTPCLVLSASSVLRTFQSLFFHENYSGPTVEGGAGRKSSGRRQAPSTLVRVPCCPPTKRGWEPGRASLMSALGDSCWARPPSHVDPSPMWDTGDLVWASQLL